MELAVRCPHTPVLVRPFVEWGRDRGEKRMGAGHRRVAVSTLPHTGMEL